MILEVDEHKIDKKRNKKTGANIEIHSIVLAGNTNDVGIRMTLKSESLDDIKKLVPTERGKTVDFKI